MLPQTRFNTRVPLFDAYYSHLFPFINIIFSYIAFLAGVYVAENAENVLSLLCIILYRGHSMDQGFDSNLNDVTYSAVIPFFETSVNVEAVVKEVTASCVLTYGTDLTDLDTVTTLDTCSATIDNLEPQVSFQFMVTSGDGGTTVLYNAMVARLGKPEITLQPVNMSGDATTDITFTVAGNAGLNLAGQAYAVQYQWMKQDGEAMLFQEISQATNVIFTVSRIHMNQDQTVIQCRFEQLFQTILFVFSVMLI